MHRRLLLSFVVALLLAGCSKAPEAPTATPSGTTHGSPAPRGTIGVSLLTLENPFFKVIGDNITAEGKSMATKRLS